MKMKKGILVMNKIKGKREEDVWRGPKKPRPAPFDFAHARVITSARNQELM
jgi:hypothetical protein